ncbi:MAG: aminotransferase class III-fold pyridoxal phosphate-dependent enzyme [Actinobacteria bacterium]|nr:aminotransferase class III-fold pyridoxal phosphate-dependent enzyme [Actinomycetota bacterium]
MNGIDRDRLASLRAAEERRFVDLHPRSQQLAAEAQKHLVAGVPMNWMRRWPGSFPVFVESASGARFVDVDGNEYVDLCLGDTGAMAGHGLPAVVEALAQQAPKGITTMLPGASAENVASMLADRFGLPAWQFALTATDANRFALRLARSLTGRSKVIVMNWCYHGTVDETFAVLDADGAVVPRPGSTGAAVDPALTTRVVEFNDLDALDAALAHGDVACVLTEPALTNIGIVLPDPGYLEALAARTRAAGALLIIDETHTICAGPGGYTAAFGLEPDILTIGKPIAGGVPMAAWGLSAELAERATAMFLSDDTDVSGVGGTLAGNALSLAAAQATLATTLTAADYEHTIALATRWTEGVARVIADAALPWHVQQLGCRAEYWFCPPPRNGGEAAAAVDHELDAFMHLWCMNRGVLLAPFHNMALMAPATTAEDVDRHTKSFASAVAALLGR